MNINELTIHNFRSIKDQSFSLRDYSLLIGANNSGKTNIIDAIRVFYEEGIKFNSDRDFPKFIKDDQDSWIDMQFSLSNDEYISLREEYKGPNNTFRVRKYFKSSTSERVKSSQSNIYGYENNKLSDNLFYGARNISEAKLGSILYIPEVTKLDEYTKLSGPSAFRDLLEFVVKKVVKNSGAFEDLSKSFDNFNMEFTEESSKDGFSLKTLIEDINIDIKDWDTVFGIKINQIKPQEIIKSLVSHYLMDNNLNEPMDISRFGQGLQRHMIYTLIKLSAKYKDKPVKKDRKEFTPDFKLILFEEPEAFLHPAQQEALNISLKNLSSENTQQVVISTHSSHFASKNIDDLPSIIKLAKTGPETLVYQVDEVMLKDILSENKEFKRLLGKTTTGKDLEQESIYYCLCLDPDRCCAFFADTVLICEGLSEKALIDTLIKRGDILLSNSRIYILNAAGKYNIHRYMNLFGKLGINHAVLFDRDREKNQQQKINKFIDNNKNQFTINTFSFSDEFEDFLGIDKVADKYEKPLNVMWHYHNKKIKEKNIKELGKIINSLVSV